MKKTTGPIIKWKKGEKFILTILYAVEPQSTHPTAYVKRK